MKTRFTIILAAVASIFASCSTETPVEKSLKEGEILITAKAPETKSVFTSKENDAYPAIWTTNKQAAFSLNRAKFVTATPSLSNEGKEADFSVSFASTPAAGDSIFAVSPAGTYDSSNSANNVPGFTGWSSSTKSVYLIIPSSQTPLAESCDEAAQAIVSTEVCSTDDPSAINMTFKHATAYGKLTITDFPGGDIDNLQITFPQAVAGTSCLYSFKTSNVSGASEKTITLDPANVVDNVFWFGCAPTGDMTSGTVTIKATGSDGKTYTKEIELSSTKKLGFNQGRVSAFSVSMASSSSEERWELVTDASTLKAGDVLVIAYNVKEVTAGAISNSVMGIETTTFSNDYTYITELGEGTLQFTLGGTAGAWTFTTGGKLLGATTVKKVALGNGTTTWTISITDGNATITNTTSGYGRFLYNVNSPRFTTYTSDTNVSMVLPQLYRKTNGSGSSDSGDDSGSTTTCAVATGAASSITTSTATLSATYSGASATPTYTGFEWGLTTSMDSDNQCGTTMTGTSGSFSVSLDNLTAGATYYYRAYAVVLENGKYVYYYGSTKSFTVSSGATVTSEYPDWYELPQLNITKSGSYLVSTTDANEYYAFHWCAGTEKAPSGGTARNYTVCFSGTHHCPLWVAAPRHSMYVGSSGRNDSYTQDGSIPTSVQYTSKNTGGGCNKGHLLGSAERTSSVATNKQVFYYSNIAPQLSSGFNTGGGGWNTLEDFVDDFVCADTLYEVVGCYFDKYTDGYGYTVSPSTITFGGRSDVSMPTMFYYALIRTKKGTSGKALKNCSADEIQCVAFVRSHTNSLKGQAVTSKELMSISDLEKITGFTYFNNVPNAPKSTFTASDWGL